MVVLCILMYATVKQKLLLVSNAFSVNEEKHYPDFTPLLTRSTNPLYYSQQDSWESASEIVLLDYCRRE